MGESHRERTSAQRPDRRVGPQPVHELSLQRARSRNQRVRQPADRTRTGYHRLSALEEHLLRRRPGTLTMTTVMIRTRAAWLAAVVGVMGLVAACNNDPVGNLN